jgi:2Fe-2S ferredoxin
VVEPLQTVLQAAVSQGVDLSHYCGGTCTCGTCRVRVLRGAANLSSMEGREQMVLGYEAAQAGDRLACQARVRGPVEIEVLDHY